MFTDKQVKDYIQDKLNDIVMNGLDIGYEDELYFDGEVAFYNYDWVKEHFGVPATPFALTPIETTISADGLKSKTTRYTIVLMPYSKQRELVGKVINKLIEDLSQGVNEKVEGYTISTRFLGTESGEDFSEGSGFAVKRYELAIDFELSSTDQLMNVNDVEIKIGKNVIPFRSFRIEHGKSNIPNKKFSTSGISVIDHRGYYDFNLVLEVFVNNDTFWIFNNKVNYKVPIEITVDERIIVDKYFSYDGFQMATEREDGILTAYLYFSLIDNGITLDINDENVKVIDYTIAFESALKPITNFNTDVVQYRYLGKAIEMAFVLPRDGNLVVQNLMSNLIENDTNLMTYQLKISFPDLGEGYTEKLCIVKSVESSENVANAIVVRFVEAKDNG